MEAIEEVPVEVIRTPAPIPMPLLKRSFSEKVLFEIDVDASRIPPARVLTYVSNVKVDTELVVSDNAKMIELVVAYMTTSLLYRSPELETLSMIVVIRSMGHELRFGGWSEEDLAALDIAVTDDVKRLWLIRMSCLPAWALYIHRKTTEMATMYPVDTETYVDGEVDPRGINFINVLDSPLIHVWIPFIRDEDIRYSKELFDGNIFASRNMFHYLAKADNPFMLALLDLLPPEEDEDVSSS